jgi:general secretion pathway protein D
MRATLLQLIATITFSLVAFGGTISTLPFSPTVSVGGSTSVNVNVAGLTDLYAFQFDVVFNPAVLSALSITEGTLFSSVGVFFSSGTISNTAGTITFIGDSLSGPGPGVSLDGTLAQIVFSALSPGSSSIGLSNVILLDSNLSDIPASVVSGSVDVTGVPEPNSAMLLLGALTLLGLVRHRFRARQHLSKC